MTQLLFDRSEFDARLATLRGRMKALGADLVLLDEMEAMFWIAGFASSQNRWRCCVVPLEGEPFFLIRKLDATPLRQRTWIADIVTFRDWEDPVAALAAKLRARGLDGKRLGLDHNSYGTSIRRLAQIRAALPGAGIVDIGPLLWELRLRKSPAEIALMRRAAAIADRAMEEAIAVCRPGASQRDAAAAASACYIRMGGDPEKVGPISAGTGWDFLHSHLGETPLKPGDVVHLELTPRITGYGARLMRCVSIGAPSPELEAAARALADIQDRQIAAMVPGAEARVVDAILREGVVAAGLRDSVDNITGYTLGYYHPATPRTSDFTRIFHPEASWRIEPGMAFHMYASAARVSFSESVVITDSGPERLGRLPRRLYVNE